MGYEIKATLVYLNGELIDTFDDIIDVWSYGIILNKPKSDIEPSKPKEDELN